MAESLTDQLFDQLNGAPLRQISQQLGVGQAQAAGAVSAALPLLLGALGRNASQPQGAEALLGALRNDHAGGGDIAGLLGAVLGGAQTRQTNGAGILGHILGGQQPRAEAALGQTTGLGNDKAGQLLKILAPIVLSVRIRGDADESIVQLAEAFADAMLPVVSHAAGEHIGLAPAAPGGLGDQIGVAVSHEG